MEKSGAQVFVGMIETVLQICRNHIFLKHIFYRAYVNKKNNIIKMQYNILYISNNEWFGDGKVV